MRKSTIFISSVLTTFALVLLYNVVSAYRNVSAASSTVVPVADVVDTATSEPTSVPTTTPSIVTPEEAAQFAAQVVGNTNLLSAETSNFNGVIAYLITFTNKDLVYVGLDGQILSVQLSPVYVNVAPPTKVKKDKDKGGGGGGGGTSSGGGEDHDDD